MTARGMKLISEDTAQGMCRCACVANHPYATGIRGRAICTHVRQPGSEVCSQCEKASR